MNSNESKLIAIERRNVRLRQAKLSQKRQAMSERPRAAARPAGRH